VERMSIRSVGVRQDTGAYHIIPWSSITTFANFVRGIGSVVANYDVDRHEDADKANQALKDAVTELMENEDIRVHVVSREQAYQWVEEGKIDNAASVIALQWLQLHHQALKNEWA
jgi:small-conductance mechanosensitive channel